MFRSQNKTLTSNFNKRRLEVINKKPIPSSDICNYCWNQTNCLLKVLNKNPPKTCFVYDFYKIHKEASLEELTKDVCENRCVQRQQWPGDPIPHTEEYCEKYCPVSGFITKRAKPKEEDIIKGGSY